MGWPEAVILIVFILVAGLVALAWILEVKSDEDKKDRIP